MGLNSREAIRNSKRHFMTNFSVRAEDTGEPITVGQQQVIDILVSGGFEFKGNTKEQARKFISTHWEQYEDIKETMERNNLLG